MPEGDPVEILVKDPLREVTRNERRALLAASLIGMVVADAGLAPKKIEAFGIEFTPGEQSILFLLVAMVTAYFLIGFVVYAWTDFVAWRLSFFTAVKAIREERVKADMERKERENAERDNQERRMAELRQEITNIDERRDAIERNVRDAIADLNRRWKELGEYREAERQRGRVWASMPEMDELRQEYSRVESRKATELKELEQQRGILLQRHEEFAEGEEQAAALRAWRAAAEEEAAARERADEAQTEVEEIGRRRDSLPALLEELAKDEEAGLQKEPEVKTVLERAQQERAELEPKYREIKREQKRARRGERRDAAEEATVTRYKEAGRRQREAEAALTKIGEIRRERTALETELREIPERQEAAIQASQYATRALSEVTKKATTLRQDYGSIKRRVWVAETPTGPEEGIRWRDVAPWTSKLRSVLDFAAPVPVAVYAIYSLLRSAALPAAG